MKTFLKINLIIFLILPSINLFGQGILKGTAVDSLTQRPMKGVEIYFSGTTYKSVSDINGEFIITGIHPGEYLITASYLGYKTSKDLVKIDSSKILELNVNLNPSRSSKLSTQRENQLNEINNSLNSDHIVEVISPNNLRDLPDENLMVTFSRLPGVSIMYKNIPFLESLSGGGYNQSYSENSPSILSPPRSNFQNNDNQTWNLYIRGLNSKYADFSMDGIRLPATSSFEKNIDFNLLPENGLYELTLDKSVTSDKDAETTAGAINMETRKAPSKREIYAKMLGNYNDLDKSANQYFFTGNYSDRFLNNLLGVQLVTNLGKKITSNNYYSKNIIENSLMYTESSRTNEKINLIIDMDTPDNGSIKLNTLYYNGKTEYFENRVDTNFLRPDYSFNFRQNKQTAFVSSLQGKNHLFGFNVNWNLAITEAVNDEDIDYNLSFYGMSTPPDFSTFTNTLDYALDGPSRTFSNERTLSVDISKQLKFSNDITSELKIGGKYRRNKRYYNEYLQLDNASLIGDNQYLILNDSSTILKDFSGTRFDGLVGKSKSDILLSYFLDNSKNEKILFDNKNLNLANKDALMLWRDLNFSEYNSHNTPSINSFKSDGSNYAGYLMNRLNFKNAIILITGIRFENELNSYDGYFFPEAKNGVVSLYNDYPVRTKTVSFNKISALPNIHLKILPTDFLNLRISAYKTLIRPDFNLRTAKIISIPDDYNSYLSIGNPNLNNAEVWNYELQVQFYGNAIGLLSANAFYKEIEGMFTSTNGITLSNVSQLETLGINWNSFKTMYPLNSGNFLLYSTYNSQKPARIWGFEIEHKTNFQYLPELLKNIVLDYNFSFLRSETWSFDFLKIQSVENGTELSEKKQKLSYMPKFFANINLGYDFMDFSFRISYFYQDNGTIFYNYFDNDIIGDRLSRLDIAAKQIILDNFILFGSINNVTNLKEKAISSIFNVSSIPVHNYQYGTNFNFGIGVKF